MRNYFHSCYQRVILNGQTSSWELLKPRVPQGSILDPPMILIYINDLASDFNKGNAQDKLREDLCKISNWAIHWKMQFKLDPKKEALEVHLSKKNSKNTRSLS